MAEQKLVGQNYSTPDLRAKVTGRARYAEDFRVEDRALHFAVQPTAFSAGEIVESPCASHASNLRISPA